MGMTAEIPSPAQSSKLSPLGEACSRVDLTAMHEILESIGYKDDEGVANEVKHSYSISIIKLPLSYQILCKLSLNSINSFDSLFVVPPHNSFHFRCGLPEYKKL